MPSWETMSNRVVKANEIADGDVTTGPNAFYGIKTFATAHPVIFASIMREYHHATASVGRNLREFCTLVKDGTIKLEKPTKKAVFNGKGLAYDGPIGIFEGMEDDLKSPLDDSLRMMRNDLNTHVEMFSAAYLKMTQLPPDKVVMKVKQEITMAGLMQTIWFEEKKNE
jgi:hypothetical protein